MAAIDVLFQPFRLKSLTLPNRVVMAPMTRSKSPNQVPGENVAAYYRRRAEGGVGLILTEGTSPEHPLGLERRQCAGLLRRNIARRLGARRQGGEIRRRPHHAAALAPGRRAPSGNGPYPEAPSMSPSGLAKPGKKVAEPMTQRDIDDVIAGFAKSAGYAKALGFDGVELHGAHGYVIDQYFWEGTNARDDQYGGSLEKRTVSPSRSWRPCARR
jgi:2,4-dienoyl-CoA reductase-like NADH-dependent reductase (Old Yellow Enzyme family)